MKIYLTNAASRKPPHRGPGRVWSIMAFPRVNFGEAGEGSAFSLVPDDDHLLALKAGEMTLALYRAHFVEQLLEGREHLAPGKLHARLPDERWTKVADGDTLICCCSRAAAAAGRCHRVWAGEALKEAGWTVVLDGVEL